MALIIRFKERRGAAITWRSEVECGYTVGSRDDRRIVHLETYGSAERSIPGKVSQSIELDEERARELVDILRRAFPNIE